MVDVIRSTLTLSDGFVEILYGRLIPPLAGEVG